MRQIFVLCLSLMLSGVASMAAPVVSAQWPIITRQGTQLMEGSLPFRFFGMTAPNLQANESQLRPDFSNRFPDEFEIRDTFETIRRLGGRATRTFALSIQSPEDKAPTHILARRTYNEEAFRCLDRVLALAHEYDVRVIIPFIASQSYGGIRGVDEFAALSGKPGFLFWTDPEIKADFRHYLEFILNRRNTVSGLCYKDDPAVLAWQLGNEFDFYPLDRNMNPEPWQAILAAWSKEMAAHLKQVDPHHLVMDSGHLNWDGDGRLRSAMVEDPNVDLISTHLHEAWCRYFSKDCNLASILRQAVEACKGRKPVVVDEFGLASTANLQNLMRQIQQEPAVAGGLLWGMRSHRRDGGWFYHNEDTTPVNSYHFPGFPLGLAFDEARQLERLRQHAYQIRGLPVPAVEKPTPAPILSRQEDGLTWRGSTGASCYTLERAESEKGPWKVVAIGLKDSVIADVKAFEPSKAASFPVVLWHDESAQPGKVLYYRMKGLNSAGETAYSNALGVDWSSKHEAK